MGLGELGALVTNKAPDPTVCRNFSGVKGNIMNRDSYCKKCHTIVVSHKVCDNRALYRCPRCGRRWSRPANYSKVVIKPSEGGAITGGIAGALAGGSVLGPVGAMVGGILGAIGGAQFWASEDTMTCIRCGGIARPTGEGPKVKGYQCTQCHRSWVVRR